MVLINTMFSLAEASSAVRLSFDSCKSSICLSNPEVSVDVHPARTDVNIIIIKIVLFSLLIFIIAPEYQYNHFTS